MKVHLYENNKLYKWADSKLTQEDPNYYTVDLSGDTIVFHDLLGNIVNCCQAISEKRAAAYFLAKLRRKHRAADRAKETYEARFDEVRQEYMALETCIVDLGEEPIPKEPSNPDVSML